MSTPRTNALTRSTRKVGGRLRLASTTVVFYRVGIYTFRLTTLVGINSTSNPMTS